MSVRKRTTKTKETAEYHYEFMQNGKRYYGVCEGCTTKVAALAYEKKIKETAKDLECDPCGNKRRYSAGWSQCHSEITYVCAVKAFSETDHRGSVELLSGDRHY